MDASGSIFFKDEYETFYETVWETIGLIIDLTSTVSQPFAYGKPPEGYIKDGVLFKKGIVTIHRQAIRPFSGGYEIVAEGYSQYEDFIRMNYLCSLGPSDHFKYHLDHNFIDECEMRCTDGPHWADPDDVDDANAIWGDLDNAGDPVDLTVAGGAEILEWIDVWA